MNRSVCVVILLLMAGTLSSCSFHRLVAGKKAKSYDWNKAVADTSHVNGLMPRIIFPQPDTIANTNDTLSLVKKLIDELTPLWQTRFVYKTFSGKAKVHYEGPDENQEFTAHFRIRKDSLIWIAITGLGGMVQVARIYVTPDSFIMVNQMQKEVTRIPLDKAAKVLPAKVDFKSLQRLVVGEPIRDGVITNATNFGGSWSLRVEDSSYIQLIIYNKADSTVRSGQLRTRDPNGPQAIIECGGYVMINNRKLSTNRVINIQNGNDVYMLDMNFMRTDFDLELDYPVSIPSTYTLKEVKK
ncbi:MAG: DUF4292 domain-containing protein [Chitinophagales bacterium]